MKNAVPFANAAHAIAGSGADPVSKFTEVKTCWMTSLSLLAKGNPNGHGQCSLAL